MVNVYVCDKEHYVSNFRPSNALEYAVIWCSYKELDDITHRAKVEWGIQYPFIDDMDTICSYFKRLGY